MILRLWEYVAADKALALACIETLEANATDETPKWQAANKRVAASEKNLPAWLAWVADAFADWWNRRWWRKVNDLQKQFDLYGETG